MRKNNIIFNVRNITLNLENIKHHLTEKAKIITLISAIIMLSFANITLSSSDIFYNSSTSALSYSSSVGVGFTFNPTLSVSISPSNLVIDNLTPGTTGDSNTINVSVATNAAYGYTLSAIMNGNNSNLTHTNSANTFSSIATNASLTNLTADNTWGYSYKLSNDTNWNNYSGLSTETSKTLVDSNEQTAIPVDFKIAAKASNTQASGTYTGVISFTAVTKHIPVTLAEAYASEGKTMINGFYTMQDMTSTICSKVEAIGTQLQVLDKRDNKLYWISKLADNKCWMTQNLDLDLDSNKTYTHYDTDLGWNDPDNLDINANWKPDKSTIDFTIDSTISGWQNSNTEPYSANPGGIYFYTSNSDANDIQYNSLQECIEADHNDCTHYHVGNYYNWSAAVASNDTSGLASGNASNSICSKGWRLPNGSQELLGLGGSYGINSASALNLRNKPIYLVRSGYGENNHIVNRQYVGSYWYSMMTNSNTQAYRLFFFNNTFGYSDYAMRYFGVSVRCLAR